MKPAYRDAQRASTHDRLCFICGEAIEAGRGLYHAWLRILTHTAFPHEHPCALAVSTREKDYTRSARGRLRSRGAILTDAYAHRCAAQQGAPSHV